LHEADQQACGHRVSGPLQAEAEATFDPKLKGFDTPRAKWMRRLHEYQNDPELLDQLMQRYFSPQFRSSYAAIAGYMNKVKEQSAKETLRGSYTLKGQKMPRWLEMSERERRNALIWGAAALFLLILGLWIQVRARPAVPRDRNELRTGFEGMIYDWATGTLADFNVLLEEHMHVTTRSDGSTPGSTTTSAGPTSVSYSTDVDEEFSLVYEGGQLDINFSHRASTLKALATQYFRGRETHRMTALWFRRKSEAYGRYVTFMDWTRREDINPWQTKRPIPGAAAAVWTMLAAVVLGWVVGSASDLIPFFDGKPRNFLMALSFGAVCAAVVFALGTIASRRSARQLVDILNAIGPDDAAPTNPKAVPPNPR
jgi:hypothetical protein